MSKIDMGNVIMQDIPSGSKAVLASSAHQKGGQRKTHRKSPRNHLYSKGNIFYFRFAFPVSLRKYFGRHELRCSLGTGYLKTARTMANTLYAQISLILRRKPLPTYDELKTAIQELNQRFYAVLKTNNDGREGTLTQEDIRLRMNEYLRRLLDQDSQDVHERLGILKYEEEQAKEAATMEIFAECTSNILQSQVNYPEGLKNLAPRIILDLVKHGFFKAEEIRTDNVTQIANEYMKMQVLCKKIVAARERGDYMYEQPVFAVPQTPSQPVLPKEHAEIQGKPALLLSELIQRLIRCSSSDLI
jgi:hypothetical protein